MMGQPQALCEEDEIINRLRESRSDGEMFFDVEFGGVATALYENESEVPEYDQDLSEPVVWLRPQELAHSPEYFVDGALSGSVVEGRLGDGWLLGAMAAISGHPELLVENLFGSDPDDFKKWGVYTCRFYKNGSWVEWVSLLEKAYAKLHGSYEALSGGSVTEALVDLTGGSGEEVKLEEKDHARLWDLVKAHAEKKHVLCGTVDVGEGLEAVRSTELRETPLGLLPAHAYGVLACVEVADQRFLHMRNPWGKGEGNGDWRGPWSNASTQWDDFPEVLTEMMNDESLAWDRNANDGTFFMAFEDFCARFDTLHVCKLFVDDKYKQYKVVGKWSGKTAGGPDAKFEAKQKADLAAAADAGPGDELNDASLKLANALRDHHGKFVRTDGDPYWFNNPQFRVTTQAPVEVHVSLTQCKNPTAPAATKGHFKMAFEVLRTKRNAEHPRIWSLDGAELVAHAPGLPAAAREAPAPEEELGRRVHKETKTNALGEPKPTKESTLRKKRPKPGVAEARQLLEGLGGASWGAGIGGLGGGFEGEPEKAMPPRKMLLEANEWHQTSNFRGATVATLLLPGIVKSRMPNGMVAVSESKSKTVVGEWVDSNSGGSHLQPSWKTNPKYKLTFANATARAKVNITLTRPEADWKMRDMVGSMMGFYLSRGAAPSTPNPGNQSPSSDGAAIFHEGKPWNESPFVPMHSVSTPPGFALEATDGSYVIMPATYAPNKKGRFFLSVTSDVDFVLTGAGGTTSVRTGEGRGA
ncbi:calcium-dependent cysteine-type endopeptidase [Aureococcus anophagefferens]|nr:calcium-dependent cysteine-type endopeptidase [Aureococcus anophagefferens]